MIFHRRTLFLIMLMAWAAAASAEGGERPDENSLFGGASDSQAEVTPVAAEATSSTTRTKATDRDSTALSSANPSQDEFASGETTDNPLQIGGIFYQQLIGSPLQGQTAGQTPLTMPLQLDTFLDARPNDRIRGYVDARLLYDPTQNEYSEPTAGNGAFAGVPSSLSSTTSTAVPSNPEVVLDQAWLKFDLDDVVFVTAGKQHVKWGASHTWNPTDFLTPQKYNPLLPYDTRLGSTMLKFEVPWQAKNTNFYAIALFDNPQPASTLQQVGGAFRAETILWNAEIGLDAVTRDGVNPVYGADISAPLGPLDVYGEAALLSGNGYSNYQLKSGPITSGENIGSLYSTQGIPGPAIQVSGGMNYSFAWQANREATLGAEYFYNELGSSNPDVYPVLIYLGQYQPFYLGKDYATFYLTAEGPDSNKETSYTFSTISNISDGSFISRLDFSWLMLSYLTIGAYGDTHYGTAGGEFNFDLNTPELNGGSIPAINRPTTPFDLGLSLRLGF